MSSILKVDQIQLADGSTPTAADLGLNTTGSVIQQQYVQQDTAMQTAATMNYHSSLPTSSQGALVFSKSFTPKSDNSVIQITFQTYAYSSLVHNAIFALFEDNVCKTAIAPRHTYVGESQDAQIMMINIPNTSTTTRTYSVRAGCQPGNGATLYINTYPGYPGAPQTVMIIQEIAG